MKDKKEKPTSTRIQCEKPIYININLNHWKYRIFNNEIFTFLRTVIEKRLKML